MSEVSAVSITFDKKVLWCDRASTYWQAPRAPLNADGIDMSEDAWPSPAWLVNQPIE